MKTADLFKWRHFLPEIILLTVRWYWRYPLSYRDIEERMAERRGKGRSFHAEPMGIELWNRTQPTDSTAFEPHQRFLARG
jgi:hypothetical protein